jgi:hypothetical protein
MSVKVGIGIVTTNYALDRFREKRFAGPRTRKTYVMAKIANICAKYKRRVKVDRR